LITAELRLFFRYTSIILIGGLAIIAYPIYAKIGVPASYGAAIALVLTYLNVLVGYFFIDKYFSAAFNTFMKMVFGSMGLRLLALAILIAGILSLTNVHKVSFTASLFISYILFSLIEVIFIQKKASSKNSDG